MEQGLDIIKYFAGMALALAVFTLLNHRRSVLRAEERGEDPPGGWDLAWNLFKPMAAFGLGCAAALLFATASLKPGQGWEGLVAIAGTLLVGLLVFAIAWAMLAVLGGGGPLVQAVLAAIVVAVVWAGLAGPLLQGPQAQKQAQAERSKTSIPHGPLGVAPRQLQVVPEGESLRVSNLAEQALVVSLARVLPREGQGYERCALSVEQRTGPNFQPEVNYRETVTFSSACAARFSAAPLEFRVLFPGGKILYMSDSAFLP
jgi:hypothetical protein